MAHDRHSEFVSRAGVTREVYVEGKSTARVAPRETGRAIVLGHAVCLALVR